MWLLTAVKDVNGQDHFTFPLEQKKTYTLGRAVTCEIRLMGRRVRLKEGTVEVGDWNPAHPEVPPKLCYRPQAKNNGAISKYTIITPSPQYAGDLNLELYAGDHSENGGVWLDELTQPGQGVRFDAGETADECHGWFFVRWVDVGVQYDGLKDQTDTIELLRRYCIAYTMAFDKDHVPTVALSPTFRAVNDLSYAVCYGIPILKPEYLDILTDKLQSSWKKTPDSEDSFSLPNTENPALRPTLDPTVAQARRAIECWLPDPKRKELFKGWMMFVLRGKGSPVEKRWITSMGCEWDDADVVTHPLLSAKDFGDRIEKWLERVDETVGRGRAIVAHFQGIKDGITNSGVDFDRVVTASCMGLGIYVASGSVCWGSVRKGSVEGYLTDIAGPRPVPTQAQPEVPLPTATPADAGPSTRRSPRKAAAALARSPSPPAPTPSRVPATPDEAMAVDPTSSAPAPARKLLRRRAGKATFDPFSMDLDPVLSEDVSPAESLEKLAKRAEESMPFPTSAQLDIESTQMPLPSQGSQSAAPKNSRLKRRAGATQASAFDILGGIDPVESIKEEEEVPADIRALYEETTRSSRLPAGRTRGARGVSNESNRDESLESASAPPARRTRGTSGSVDPGAGADAMEVDGQANAADPDPETSLEFDEEDYVQRTLRRVADAKKGVRVSKRDKTDMPPPALPMARRRSRSPMSDEESERVEPKRPRLASPKKGKAAQAQAAEDAVPSNTPTQDTAFLQAVATSKSRKKEVDELDKEFNNLRIPKPVKGRGKGTAAAAATATAEGDDAPAQGNKWDGPDYSVLNDFTDDMRGNFIQVVKVDLFRKDGGRKEAERMDDGKPNFKKFKKKTVVRREPVSLVLVGPNAEEAELGEPYWLDGSGSGRRGNTQDSQARGLGGRDEDSLPVLPPPRKTRKVLRDDDDDDDELGPTPIPQSARRRGGTFIPDSQATGSVSGRTLAPATQRRTRAGSAMSEDSTISATRATRRGAAASSVDTVDSATAKPAKVGRVAAAAAAAAADKAKKGRGKVPIVLEDSDEDELKFTPSHAGSTATAAAPQGAAARRRAGAGAGAGAGGSGGTTQSRLFVTDEAGDGTVASSTAPTRRRGAAATAGTGSGSRSGTASKGSTAAVRKVLVDDDDDDDMPVMPATAKRRRVG